MSLAAPLATDGVRPVSFLPSIKCSDCGNEIQIAEMGDHVCTTKPPVNGTAFDTAAHAPSQQRLQRMPPPRINANAANKPFLAPFDAPLSPALSSRSGGSSLGRSVYHTRLFDFRPPSPELSANLDCAFPPFPTSAATDRRPSTSHGGHGRKTPTGNDRAQSRGGSRLDHVTSAKPEPLDMAPKSPYTGSNAKVLQKLDALKNSPFGASRRKASGSARTGEIRRPSLAPTEDSRPVTATHCDSSPQQMDVQSGTSHAFDEQHSQRRVPPARPARPTEEVLRLSFLDQMSEIPAKMMAASLGQNSSQDFDPFPSNTYPLPTLAGADEAQGSALTRMRSAPRLHAAGDRPSFEESTKCDHVNIPQDYHYSLSHRTDTRLEDAPPVPRAMMNYRDNMTHTPTGSNSSVTSSTNSRANTNSSGISPVGSVASSLDPSLPLAIETIRYGEDEQMRVPALNVSRSPEKPAYDHERSVQHSPPPNFAHPATEQDAPGCLTNASLTPLESPMDPALSRLQDRTGNTFEPWASVATGLAPIKLRPMPDPAERATPPSDLPFPKPRGNDDPPSSTTRLVERSLSTSNRSLPSKSSEPQRISPTVLQPPPVPQEASARRQHGRRPTNAKPMCRGCGLIIEGKSVKAADGRLTGRWHKACFVCRSCQQPFMTADFYVINNEPYCEQHYHEKNGSLCNGCHRGIEGQYLETSTSTRFGSVDKKFHPRCFTCCECRQVLAQDYFEITGRVYCERHALAAMRAHAQARLGSGLQPDRRNLLAERRTTRLINPMMA